MPLTFPKWPLSKHNPVAPRAQLSRLNDRFELDLREALKDLPFTVQSNMVLSDFVALTVEPGKSKGQIIREARKQLDFVVLTQRPAFPVVAIMLTNREYGRDRRAPPAISANVEVNNNVMVTLLHLNPKSLEGAEVILEVLKPYL